MTLQRFASICTSFALICSMLLGGPVGRAQQAEKSSSGSKKTTKKNKRKRQTRMGQFVLPPPSVLSPISTSVSVDAPSISPGAPITVKTEPTVNTQSVKGGQQQDTVTQPVRIE